MESYANSKRLKSHKHIKKINFSTTMIITTLIIGNILLFIASLSTINRNEDTYEYTSIIVIIMIIIVMFMALDATRSVYSASTPKHYQKNIIIIGIFVTVIHMIISIFAFIAYDHGLMYNGEKVEVSLSDAYYFSIVTLTTLGYGDFSPIREMRIYFAIEAMLGYFLFAIFTGMIVGLNLNKKYIKRKHIKNENKLFKI